MLFFHAKIIFPNSSKSKTIRIPAVLLKSLRWVRYGIALGLVCLLLQIGCTFGYRYFLEKSVATRHSLEQTLSQLLQTSDSLNSEMENFFQSEDLLFAMAGLEPLDHSIRELGTGGEVVPEEVFLQTISTSASLLSDMRESSERLGNKIEMNQTSFRSIGSILERQTDAWRFIPSISPAKGRYASAFGHRNHPITGERGKMHYGIDISNSPWTPIYAAADGVVQVAKNSSSFGNFVALNHGNGFVTKYGHMTRFIVQVGQVVRRYQIIGYMGNTGRSAGPHLHYEVWLNGNAVNPLAYILPNDHAIE